MTCRSRSGLGVPAERDDEIGSRRKAGDRAQSQRARRSELFARVDGVDLQDKHAAVGRETGRVEGEDGREPEGRDVAGGGGLGPVADVPRQLEGHGYRVVGELTAELGVDLTEQDRADVRLGRGDGGAAGIGRGFGPHDETRSGDAQCGLEAVGHRDTGSAPSQDGERGGSCEQRSEASARHQNFTSPRTPIWLLLRFVGLPSRSRPRWFWFRSPSTISRP